MQKHSLPNLFVLLKYYCYICKALDLQLPNGSLANKMEETLDFIAHVDADGKTQSVEDHAEGVARLCSEFCAQIDPDWSEVALFWDYYTTKANIKGLFKSTYVTLQGLQIMVLHEPLTAWLGQFTPIRYSKKETKPLL